MESQEEGQEKATVPLRVHDGDTYGIAFQFETALQGPDIGFRFAEVEVEATFGVDAGRQFQLVEALEETGSPDDFHPLVLLVEAVLFEGLGVGAVAVGRVNDDVVIIRFHERQRGTAFVEPAQLHTAPIGLAVDAPLLSETCAQHKNAVDFAIYERSRPSRAVTRRKPDFFQRVERAKFALPKVDGVYVLDSADVETNLKALRVDTDMPRVLVAIDDSLVEGRVVGLFDVDLLGKRKTARHREREQGDEKNRLLHGRNAFRPRQGLSVTRFLLEFVRLAVSRAT